MGLKLYVIAALMSNENFSCLLAICALHFCELHIYKDLSSGVQELCSPSTKSNA